MKQKLIFLLMFFSTSLLAQDIDLYHKKQNDDFLFPKIDKKMSFEEFQLLSRNLRMMDMVYAAIVPGYTHFYVKDKKIGYAVLAARLIAYSGLTYILSDADSEFESLLTVKKKESYQATHVYKKSTAYSNVLKTSVTIVLTSYLFDWIHGQYHLKVKKENIRYKYSLTFKQMSLNNNERTNILGVGLSLRF